MWDPEIFEKNVKNPRTVPQVLAENLRNFSPSFYTCKLVKYLSTPLTFIENIGYTTVCDDRYIHLATGINVTHYIDDQCYRSSKNLLAYVVLGVGLLLKYILVIQIIIELVTCFGRKKFPILFVSFILMFLFLELQGRYIYPLLIYMLYENDF